MAGDDMRLSPTGADAAIDGKDRAGGVAGTVGGEERHQVAEFARMRGAAERKALLKLLVAVLVAKLVFGASLQQGDVAVGSDRTGIDADDADVVGEALAAERAGERHQRRIAGTAGGVIGIEFFAGGADVVDEDAVAARVHLPVVSAAR